MRKNLIDISNLLAAACAFMAAITWISSGVLGEFSLGVDDTSTVSTAARNAAKLNTTAAWGALFSSLFVMVSSMISMWPKSINKKVFNNKTNQAMADFEIKRKDDLPNKIAVESDKPVNFLLGISILVALLFLARSKKL